MKDLTNLVMQLRDANTLVCTHAAEEITALQKDLQNEQAEVARRAAAMDRLRARATLASGLIDAAQTKAWAHLPTYQRTAALGSIRKSAEVRDILSRTLRGTEEQHRADEDRADAQRIAADALDAMALEVLRHDDA